VRRGEVTDADVGAIVTAAALHMARFFHFPTKGHVLPAMLSSTAKRRSER
jgi:hypothetical protein